MYFGCKFFIEVNGTMVLETVNSVSVDNDISQIGSTCEIILPLKCRVKNEDTNQYLIDYTTNLFKKGDTIEVTAWYEGYETTPDYGKQTIFSGYIYDFVEGTPLKMRCKDYAYILQINGEVNLSFSDRAYNFKEIVEKIIEGTGITLKPPYIEIPDLVNFNFSRMSRLACLEELKKQLPFLLMTMYNTQLFIGVATSEAKTIKLRTDTNVIDAKLQKPDGAFDNINVKVTFKKADGTKDIFEVEPAFGSDPKGESHEIPMFNFLVTKDGKADTALMNKYGKYFSDNLKMGHYKGKITTLLYPAIDLFDIIEFEDIRYKERSAKYTVRSVNTTLDKDGFHRELTVSYLKTLKDAKSS
jgi:hypothetical protein